MKTLASIILTILFCPLLMCGCVHPIEQMPSPAPTLAQASGQLSPQPSMDEGLQDGQLSVAQAKELVNQYIDAITDTSLVYYKNPVEELTAVDIPDAWVKMKLQAFKSADEGYFLIQKGSVMPLWDLWKYQIADLDKDGIFELVTLHIEGSGISVFILDVFKEGALIASQGYMLNDGTFMELEKVDDTTIKLLRVNGVRQVKDDFGRLFLTQSGGKYHIAPAMDVPDTLGK